MDVSNEIIKELINNKQKMIMDALQKCGFCEEYVKLHTEEFGIIYDFYTGYETYVREGKKLFTFGWITEPMKVEKNSCSMVTKQFIKIYDEKGD